jgi:D-glycero-D-manno-heptose 1,7-bisphosphate phosphatase
MLDRFYICPHHPTEGKPPYNVECECRKPKPGMLLRGKMEFNLDLSQCFVVGDRVVDVKAGQAVGATTVLVRTGYGKHAVEECKESDIHPAHIAESITEAVDYILEQVKCRKEIV